MRKLRFQSCIVSELFIQATAYSMYGVPQPLVSGIVLPPLMPVLPYRNQLIVKGERDVGNGIEPGEMLAQAQ